MPPSPSDNLFDLTDRVALVTGGSRGLGREIVLGYARAGADVVIASRKLDACEELAREVEASTGRRALAVRCHVGHWDDVEALVDATYAHFGRVDVLVNNAGLGIPTPSVLDVTEEMFDKVLAVNLTGPFRLTSLVGTRMVEAGGGSIINMGSIAAIRPTPAAIPYATSKAALATMTVAFAKAFGPSVRVNCILAGTFLTEANQNWDQALFARLASRFALGRGAAPSEIVGTALYFACDASSYTTGSVLTVEGGMP